MAALAGIWTHHPAPSPMMASSRPASHPVPMTGPASGSNGDGNSSSSDDNGATISANDFLTLLVTEMQNQDPTDDTDPNEYIDQLVQVNSLEQLIDINQTLATAMGGSSGAPSGDVSTPRVSGPQVSGAAAGLAPATPDGAPSVVHPAAHKASALGKVQSAAAISAAAGASHAHGAAGVKTAPGNLSVPSAKSAAHRVAEALNGHARGS
jgi:flagellar basal-body rod modification protein FlgD